MKKILIFLTLISFLFSLADAMESEEYFPVIILGGGPGATTAATYLARGGITPLVITGPVAGGTITLSDKVQNWPGELFISGDALSEKLLKQAELNGAVLRLETVVAVNVDKRPFTITTKSLIGDKKKQYKTDSCIIAMGASPNLLNIPGEQTYWARGGVSTCAVCDGTLYKNQTVAVVGGGDTAILEAQYLSNLAKKVYLIVRKEQLSAIEKVRAQEVLARSNIEVLYETVVREIKGDKEKMTHLILQNNRKKEMFKLPVNALFLAIGSRPNTELFSGQLELDEKNYIILKKNQETSVEGVFAIGDVADPEFKQAITAAGDGAKAALQAQKFLIAYSPDPQKKQIADVDEEKVIEITTVQHFERLLKEYNGWVFVDFYSNRCGPCRAFKPMYESWAKDFDGKIHFLKANADVVGELFVIYQVKQIPTLAIFNANGELVVKRTGMQEITKIEKCLRNIKDKEEIAARDFK